MWSDHKVDVQAPTDVAITAPIFVIKPGNVTIRGTAVDESAIPLINIEILHENGTLETIMCADETPEDGRWGCNWFTGLVSDGTIFQLRAQAVDIFGQEGEWSSWVVLEIDATAPTLNVAFADRAFGAGIHNLSGSLADERGIGTIHVCWEEFECSIHNVVPETTIPPGTLTDSGLWSTYLLPPADLEVDGHSRTITVYGADLAGNRSETTTITYEIDNVPPDLTVEYVNNQIPSIGAHLIMSGTVSDGSHSTVNILVDPPSGLRQRMTASVVENGWFFRAGLAAPGLYTMWVQAIDEAGNTTTVGSFTVTVVAGSASTTTVFLPAFYKP
jgi:hypothetical protein